MLGRTTQLGKIKETYLISLIMKRLLMALVVYEIVSFTTEQKVTIFHAQLIADGNSTLSRWFAELTPRISLA